MKDLIREFRNLSKLAVMAFVLALIAVTGHALADSDCAGPAVAIKTTKIDSMDPLESRIKTLHDKLKITEAQEGLWQGVADAMRDNARNMGVLLKRIKSEKAADRNAVTDMKAYGEIAEAHAKSIKNFIPAFEALYDGLSEDQKKTIEESDLRF